MLILLTWDIDLDEEYGIHINEMSSLSTTSLDPNNVDTSAVVHLVPDVRSTRRFRLSILVCQFPWINRHLSVSSRTFSFRRWAWVDDDDSVNHLILLISLHYLNPTQYISTDRSYLSKGG